jgi:predicted nucleotidyltransferase
VRQRRFGRSSLWSADPDHFLTEHLKGLATLEADAWRELTGRLGKALGGRGVEEALLFGSMSRGDEEPGSDIDVLLVFASQRKAERYKAEAADIADGFQRRFGNELEAIAYGPDDLRRGGAKRLLDTARREGVRLEVGR